MDGIRSAAKVWVGVAAAVTFSTGLAAAAGIVPRIEGTATVQTAQAGTSGAWMDREAEVVHEVIPTEVVPDAPAIVVPAAPPEVVSAPTTSVVVPPVVETPAPPTSAPVAAVAPAPPVAPALPARRIPSPAEVQEAIRGMEQFVSYKSGLFGLVAGAPTPTAAQVDELGALVCTALDDGQTVEQAKATGMAMAADNPYVTISPAGADYVVRTAVRLYCPGHTDKLG